MDKDEIKYIINYHSNFMTIEESTAWKHWSTNCNSKQEKSTPEQEVRKRRMFLKSGWLTEDEKILALLKDGIDRFEQRVAERIIKEENINFNNCPKCKMLARTPKAKQCRYCEFNWHG